MNKVIIYITLISIFLGCSRDIPTPQERLSTANNIAIQNHLQAQVFKTKKFQLFSYKKTTTCKDTMSIYIEGDGFAWKTSSTISNNPTPLNPMALKLMAQDNSTCKVYLARPCQYVESSTCNNKYWTSHRFAKEVLQSYIETLDTLKKEHNVKKFELFGYSGGGTIATLVSAKRNDIKQLVTVAGNLDIDYWTKKHYITPLEGSLNPVNYVGELKNIRQLHLIGGKDNIIDKSIFDSYSSYFTDKSNINFKIYKDFTHSCCWDEEWKSILEIIN